MGNDGRHVPGQVGPLSSDRGLGARTGHARETPWGWEWEDPPAAFSPTPVGGGFTPETWNTDQDTDRKREFQFREVGFG